MDQQPEVQGSLHTAALTAQQLSALQCTDEVQDSEVVMDSRLSENAGTQRQHSEAKRILRGRKCENARCFVTNGKILQSTHNFIEYMAVDIYTYPKDPQITPYGVV